MEKGAQEERLKWPWEGKTILPKSWVTRYSHLVFPASIFPTDGGLIVPGASINTSCPRETQNTDAWPQQQPGSEPAP